MKRIFGGENEGDNNGEYDEDEEEINEKNENGTPAEKIGDNNIEEHEELLVVDRKLVHENNILEESDSAVASNESKESTMDKERSNEAVSSDCDVDAAANHQDTASMVAIKKNHAVNNKQIDLLSETIETEPSNSSPTRVVKKEVDNEGEVRDVFDDDKSAPLEQVQPLQETIAANAVASEEQLVLQKKSRVRQSQ